MGISSPASFHVSKTWRWRPGMPVPIPDWRLRRKNHFPYRRRCNRPYTLSEATAPDDFTRLSRPIHGHRDLTARKRVKSPPAGLRLARGTHYHQEMPTELIWRVAVSIRRVPASPVYRYPALPAQPSVGLQHETGRETTARMLGLTRGTACGPYLAPTSARLST